MTMRWKPIETAPKDGTLILACVVNYDARECGYPTTISWRVYHPNVAGKECWRDAQGYRAQGFTHWMPLPESPTEREKTAMKKQPGRAQKSFKNMTGWSVATDKEKEAYIKYHADARSAGKMPLTFKYWRELQGK